MVNGFGAARARSRAKITDRCLQLFGGYGYMEQYHPISRMCRDARVASIYVRTNEFIKVPFAGFAGRSP